MSIPPIKIILKKLVLVGNFCGTISQCLYNVLQVDVIAAAGAIHDVARKGAKQARHHQRRRRTARGSVAHVRTAASHAARPAAGLQYPRGHHRALRRLLAAGQRVLLRQVLLRLVVIKRRG